MERVLKEKVSHDSASSGRVAQGKFVRNTAQSDIASRIDNSPRMTAQRQKLQGMFGGAAQLHGGDEMPHDKFDTAQRVAGEMGQFANEPAADNHPSAQLRNTVNWKPASIIQRYQSLASENYEVERDEEDGDHLFTTQSKEPLLHRSKGKNKNYSIKHDIKRTNDKQNLKLADDGTLAINDTAADAKEFYASDSVFKASSEKLNDVKSQIKLVKGSGLRLNTGNTLSRITPDQAGEEVRERAGEFASLVSHICIEMASGVMGNSDSSYDHEAVFQTPGSEEERVMDIHSNPDQGDPKVKRLAASIAASKKGATMDVHREAMIDETRDNPEMGKIYGKQSGKGQLKNKEKKAGINRFAHPDVGEGYATFSVQGDADRNMDYATGGDAIERLGSTWGYHFAGVVAKSADGKDTITLENYNRTDEVYNQLKVLLLRIITANKERISEELHDVEPEENESRWGIQAKLVRALEIARHISAEKAQQEFLKIAGTYTATSSWFFQMQGSGEGQSFHEQQAASGGFVNPITLRVRPRDQETVALRQTCADKIREFTGPPALIAASPEYAGMAALRANCLKEINNAETKAQIRNKCKEGLSQISVFLITKTVNVAAGLSQEAGAGNQADGIRQVAEATKLKAKTTKAQTVIRQIDAALLTRYNALWFYQRAAIQANIQARAGIAQALGYITAIKQYFDLNK